MLPSTVVEEAQLKLKGILNTSVDGPTRLVADAILNSPAKVRSLALDGGLVTNELRQIAWPYMLSERPFVEESERIKRDEKSNTETFKQIDLDVPRSVIAENRDFLTKFLKDFFKRHVDLCFYQGFADVAWTILQVLTDGEGDENGVGTAHYVLGRLSRDFFLRDAHRINFDAVFASLEAVNSVILKCDKDLSKLWKQSGATTHWAICPLVCLFTHDLENLSLKAKILDAVIACETRPDFPLYLVASLVLSPTVKSKIVDTECEASSVHETLLEASRDEAVVDQLVEAALALRERVPPKFLLKAAEAAGLPADSCLLRSQQNQAASNTLSKKRSWRTYSFFASLAPTTAANVEVDTF